jgi:hypothetical protein
MIATTSARTESLRRLDDTASHLRLLSVDGGRTGTGTSRAVQSSASSASSGRNWACTCGVTDYGLRASPSPRSSGDVRRPESVVVEGTSEWSMGRPLDGYRTGPRRGGQWGLPLSPDVATFQAGIHRLRRVCGRERQSFGVDRVAGGTRGRRRFSNGRHSPAG